MSKTIDTSLAADIAAHQYAHLQPFEVPIPEIAAAAPLPETPGETVGINVLSQTYVSVDLGLDETAS